MQPVKALVVETASAPAVVAKSKEKELLDLKISDADPNPKTIKSPVVQNSLLVNKNEIKVVVTDDIEKFKRNQNFRKSLRNSIKRPVSSPLEVNINLFINLLDLRMHYYFLSFIDY